jgi:hypothetical protein
MRKSIITLALLIGGASISLAQPGSVVNFKDILLGPFPDTIRLSTWMEWVEQNIGGGGGADSVRAAHKADTVTSALPQAQINGLTAALGAKADTAGVKSAIHDTAQVLRTQMPSPGGTNGQLQYNNNGTFGGLNASTLVVDSARAAGSAKNLQGGATGAIPFQTAAGTTSFDASNLTWDNTNKRLGIGTTNPTVPLSVKGASSASDGPSILRFDTNAGANNSSMKIGAVAGSGSAGYAWLSAVRTGVDNVRNLVLQDPSGGAIGNVGIGTTSPDSQLTVNLGVNIGRGIRAANLPTGTGTPIASASGNIVLETSLREKKDGFAEIENAKAILLALHPQKYRWKDSGQQAYGMIADDVEAVDSLLVFYNDGKLIDYSDRGVLAIAIKVIQEHEQRISALEKRNAFLGIFAGVLLVGLVVFIVRKH